MKKLISVFTPVYNRAHLIEKCYNSLIDQTNKDFVWLVIDDGSTDNLKEKINKFIKDDKIKIEFYSKENGGKHTAYNLAIKKCKTKYFSFLDSDDIYLPEAIDIFLNHLKEIDKLDNVAGIIGNRYDKNYNVIGNKMPSIKFCNTLELYQKYGHTGDTCSVWKTKILIQYLFPVFEEEKFMPENVILDRIAEKYVMKNFLDIVYIGEYMQDGLTKNNSKLKITSPNGIALSMKIYSETALTLKLKLKSTILYVMWCKKENIKDYCKNYRNRFFVIILYPFILFFMLIKYPRNFFKD